MQPANPLVILDRQYPVYAAGRRFYQILKTTATLLDAPSRLLLAQILLYLANGLDALADANLTIFIAPQLVRVQELAQSCREFASTLQRFALFSRGRTAIVLAQDAQGALMHPSTDTNSVLTVLHGTRFY
jgi:hypothetical protein